MICLSNYLTALFVDCSAYVIGFAVNGINNVNIAAYERRYLLSSKDSGLVASFYDIAAGLTVSLFYCAQMKVK